MTNDTGAVTTVERAFDVVEYLREVETATLAEVTEALDIAKSTAHRHLQTLEGRGYVIREDDAFTLGMRFLDHGYFVRRRDPAYELAREKVEELAQRTDERAQFIVEEHGEAIYVHCESGNHAVMADSRLGKRVPIHASAAGLAILSGYDDQRVRDIIDRRGLEQRTPETISDVDELFEELERVRSRGYSVNDQGTIEGLRSVGAPIVGPDDEVIGGLSVAGPINRIKGERFEEELPELIMGATNELELNIAYR
ncbi:MAG: IclR family transcriptional regulator [Halolamina sp.]